MQRLSWVLIVSLAMAACAVACESPPSVVVGTWGGDHAGLVATTIGGTMEYDCAAGRITEPLRPGSNGRFVALGTHTPGHGGPVRIDSVLPSRPARYTGFVDGNLLSLTVVMTDSNVTVGTFQLARGRSPNVFKCL